ncbi:Uncharacterised protein [uncultured archaeon]|nr:Uncharacterised protein [uncultured archaeon]
MLELLSNAYSKQGLSFTPQFLIGEAVSLVELEAYLPAGGAYLRPIYGLMERWAQQKKPVGIYEYARQELVSGARQAYHAAADSESSLRNFFLDHLNDHPLQKEAMVDEAEKEESADGFRGRFAHAVVLAFSPLSRYSMPRIRHYVNYYEESLHETLPFMEAEGGELQASPQLERLHALLLRYFGGMPLPSALSLLVEYVHLKNEHAGEGPGEAEQAPNGNPAENAARFSSGKRMAMDFELLEDMMKINAESRNERLVEPNGTVVLCVHPAQRGQYFEKSKESMRSMAKNTGCKYIEFEGSGFQDNQIELNKHILQSIGDITGPLTIAFDNHGSETGQKLSPNASLFRSEQFEIGYDRLFAALKNWQLKNPDQKAKLIFMSCLSYDYVLNLYRLWDEQLPAFKRPTAITLSYSGSLAFSINSLCALRYFEDIRNTPYTLGGFMQGPEAAIWFWGGNAYEPHTFGRTLNKTSKFLFGPIFYAMSLGYVNLFTQVSSDCAIFCDPGAQIPHGSESNRPLFWRKKIKAIGQVRGGPEKKNESGPEIGRDNPSS